MSLLQSFAKLKNTVHKYRNYVVKPRLLKNDKVATEFVSRIVGYLDAFNDLLRHQPTSVRDAFWIEHVANICVIHDSLVGKFAKTFTIRQDIDQALRNPINQLFGLFSKRPSFGYLPTVLFNEFCKGITYFDNEDIHERPSYHRDASCGSATKTAIEKFSIQTKDTPEEVIRKKAAVRLCYIERLIYDDIYRTILYSQDISHLFEKQTMDRLHSEYFPSDNITVKLIYNDVVFPVVLSVTTVNSTNGSTTIETYAKPWKGTTVKCTKIMGEKCYNKTQEFSKKEEWGQ